MFFETSANMDFNGYAGNNILDTYSSKIKHVLDSLDFGTTF